jgi:geranylgeranyl pyrophosphate synthase
MRLLWIASTVILLFGVRVVDCAAATTDPSSVVVPTRRRSTRRSSREIAPSRGDKRRTKKKCTKKKHTAPKLSDYAGYDSDDLDEIGTFSDTSGTSVKPAKMKVNKKHNHFRIEREDAVAGDSCVDEYIGFENYEVIRQKTASLIASCCAVGAASVGASAEVVAKAKLLGEKIGMSFQIKDDLFDYGSDDVGKPLGIDIKEKKMTLPLIYALNNSDWFERRKIINIVKNEVN